MLKTFLQCVCGDLHFYEDVAAYKQQIFVVHKKYLENLSIILIPYEQ